jgi:outer membrane protein OmpA-like peptidoglycan-associated protein
MANQAAPSFLNQLISEFGGETLTRIASAIGESPGKTQTALSSVLPAVMSSLATKASTPQGATELLDVMKRNNLDTGQYANVAGAIGAPNAASNLIGTGNSLLSTLFGNRTKAVTDWVASQAGINPASSGSLLSLAVPLVLGLIGRRLGGRGVSGLMDLLSNPGSFFQNAPAGLADILGQGGASAAAGQAAKRAGAYVAEAPPAQSSIWKWIVPLALLLGVLGLVYYWNRTQAPKVAVEAAPVTAPPATAVTPPAAPNVNPNLNLGEFVEKKLPNGVSLRIPANGIENKLVGFIEDTNKVVDKDTWFSFDRLEFETGSATLKPTSREQLRNISEILKAYPNVAVKLGGYTDNTGNAAQNMKLSEDRATTTMRELTALGIDASRMAAEGYGGQFPVADNATEEGRQRNRRIDVRVTKK